ncbi:hypothetical protein PG988_007917 [Apiospora saccharicola]
MKIPHFVWIAAFCGRLALAATDGIDPVKPDGVEWPNAHIEVCNGANFTQECGKVDMSEKFLGKCSEYSTFPLLHGKTDLLRSIKETIPYGIFYGRVSPNATPQEELQTSGGDLLLTRPGLLFAVCRGINCIGSRVMFQNEINDLHGHCGFGGGPLWNGTVPAKRPSDAPGQTKSFACYKPEYCEELRRYYQDCKIVKPYGTFFP